MRTMQDKQVLHMPFKKKIDNTVEKDRRYGQNFNYI